MLSILLLLAQVIPGSIGAGIQAYLQDKIAKNTQPMVDNVEATRVQADEDKLLDLERRAALGDKAAQDEIRRRQSE